MKAIKFFGHEFVLHPCGLLIWPQENLAVVSDLHLEKASYFAQRGQFLPPHESYETLRDLSHNLEFCGVKKVILLGDSFHDSSGYDRLDDQSYAALENLNKDFELIWITGNHDRDFVPKGARITSDLRIQNIIFRHETVEDAQGEISGHFHPKARLTLRGQTINKPCFIEDGIRMIMPAYGTLTGGLDITKPPINRIFQKNFIAHILGKNQIYSIPSTKL